MLNRKLKSIESIESIDSIESIEFEYSAPWHEFSAMSRSALSCANIVEVSLDSISTRRTRPQALSHPPPVLLMAAKAPCFSAVANTLVCSRLGGTNQFNHCSYYNIKVIREPFLCCHGTFPGLESTQTPMTHGLSCPQNP